MHNNSSKFASKKMISPQNNTNPVLKSLSQTAISEIAKKCNTLQQLTPIDIKDLFKRISMALLQLKINNKQIQQHQQKEIKNRKTQQEVFYQLRQQINANTYAIQQIELKILQPQQLANKLAQIEQNTTRNYKHLQKQMNRIKRQLQQKLDIYLPSLSSMPSKLFEVHNQKIVGNSSNHILCNRWMNDANQLSALDWVDKKCYYYHHIQLNGSNIISKLASQYECVYLFGKTKISDKNSFTVYVNNFKNIISIGIADQSYINQSFIGNIKNKIEYYNNRYLWDGKSIKYRQGKGYKKGECVTLIVNIQEHHVIWKVGSQVRATCVCKRIKDKSIKWVPYIFLRDNNDEIKILA